MKRILTLLTLLAASVAASAQSVPALKVLPMEQRAGMGFTHVQVWKYSDLTALATTNTLTVTNFALPARWLVRNVAWSLDTAFDGPSITALNFEIGWDSAAGTPTDDPDGLIDHGSAPTTEICGAATEILAGDANGAAFATLRTGLATRDATDIEMIWTATGANLTVLTNGQLTVWYDMVDLSP